MKKIILDCDPGMGRLDGHCHGRKVGSSGSARCYDRQWELSRRDYGKECPQGSGNAWAHRHSCGARHGAANGASLPQGSVFPRCRWSGGKLSA